MGTFQEREQVCRGSGDQEKRGEGLGERMRVVVPRNDGGTTGSRKRFFELVEYSLFEKNE